jgi:opine dehydrogenase
VPEVEGAVEDRPRIAVLGGGHGAFAFAADLSIRGFDINLFEVPEMAENLAEIRAQGGIRSEPDPTTGLQAGFGRLQKITTDAAEALDGVDVAFVVVPAYAQERFAQAMAPHVRRDQIVVLSPGNFGGAVLFARTLRENGCDALPAICEQHCMIYGARKSGPASVKINGFKRHLRIAAFPSQATDSVMPILLAIYPTMVPVENVLWTGLSNTNTPAHPSIMILNAGWTESQYDYLFYIDGVTAGVERVVNDLDNERIAVGAKLGLQLLSLTEMDRIWYEHQGARGTTYREVCQNPNLATFYAPKTLDHRFLWEDIPYGLVPLEDLGRLVGVETPVCSAFISLGSSLLGLDFRKTGRTLKSLGLEGIAIAQLRQLVEQGLD